MNDNVALTQPSTKSLINFMPQNMLDELLAIRDTMTHSYWRIGNIVNELHTLSIANHLDVGRLEICAAVGRVVGKAMRSVRLYASVAAFYTADAQRKYDVLPYSHYVFAMSYGQDWERVMRVSLDYMEKHGIPPSLESMKGLMLRDPEQPIDNIGEVSQNILDSWEPEDDFAGEPTIIPPPSASPVTHDVVLRRVASRLQDLMGDLTILQANTTNADIVMQLSQLLVSARETMEHITGRVGRYIPLQSEEDTRE